MTRGGTNLLRVRDFNQQVVLEAIRQGDGVSRVEISRETGLTAQTISNIVRRLLGDGLVVEAGKGPSAGNGKPRVRLEINPGAGYAAGVQIDRDEVLLVLLDLKGQTVARDGFAMPPGERPADVVAAIGGSLRRLVRAAKASSGNILGLGVACPGPLDPSTGVVHAPPGLPGWSHVPVKALLEVETGYEVSLDYDAVASAVGERWAGEARGVDDFAFVYGGWGLGAGLFLDGRVYRGKTSTAGELGHTPLDPNGPECQCGNRGCLVRYCSPASIVASVEGRLRAGGGGALSGQVGGVTYEALRRAAVAGDALAVGAFKTSAEMMGKAVIVLGNLLDVEMVVLGGRAFEGVGRIYEEEIDGALEGRLLYKERRRVRAKISGLGGYAGAVGAASLVLHAAYAPRLLGLRSA